MISQVEKYKRKLREDKYIIFGEVPTKINSIKLKQKPNLLGGLHRVNGIYKMNYFVGNNDWPKLNDGGILYITLVYMMIMTY